MKLRGWEVFAAAMRTGSLTKAGEATGISQPAVSQILRHLEDRLGIRLFHRGSGRIAPTADAAALFPKAAALLEQLSALEDSARDLRNQITGTVAVACIPTLAVSVLPVVIAGFRARQPNVKVQLEVRPSDEAIALVRSGAMDLGVVHAAATESRVAIVDQVTTAMICVMPRDHPATAHAVLTPELIGDQPVITGRSALGAAVNTAFARRGRTRHSLVEVNHSLVACALAAQGMGIAVVDPFVTLDAFPDLVARPFMPRIDLETYIIAPSQRPPGVLAAMLIAGLGAVLRGAPPPA